MIDAQTEQKVAYLKKYRISTAKINRIRAMIRECPEDAERYKTMLYNARFERMKIEKEIDTVDGGVLSEILSQKYICGKSLEEIAYCINYSKRQVERLHLKALQKFEIT